MARLIRLWRDHLIVARLPCAKSLACYITTCKIMFHKLDEMEVLVIVPALESHIKNKRILGTMLLN